MMSPLIIINSETQFEARKLYLITGYVRTGDMLSTYLIHGNQEESPQLTYQHLISRYSWDNVNISVSRPTKRFLHTTFQTLI